MWTTWLIYVGIIVLVFSSHAIPNSLRIYGPGWETPQLIFPARYFFVQQVGNASLVKSVDIQGLTSKHCPVWVQFLNQTQFENIAIVRYRLLESCLDGIRIKLLDEANQVIVSKEVTEPVYHEKCDCHLPNWYKLMKCDASSEMYQQIYKDLRVFNNSRFNFKKSLEEVKSRFAPHTRSYSFCHYVIKNNNIFRQCYGEYVGFSQFIDDMLVSLIKKTPLPDLEFMMNLGDWPLSDQKGGSAPFPMFSWCGSDDTNDIVLPTYEITESTLHMQDRISVDILSVFGKQTHPDFENKIPKLFWRGRDSNRHRLHLVELSKTYPKLIDAAFTNFFFFRDEMDKYGPSVPHVSFFDFFKFKYQLAADGTVAAYRMPNLLAGNSLILKPESKYYEHFYFLLKEKHHYVPVAGDLNDLIPTLKMLLGKSDSSKRTEFELSESAQKLIVNNARRFVLDYLLPENIYCYYYKAFYLYSSLFKYVIQPADDMTLVYSKSKATCKCEISLKDEL